MLPGDYMEIETVDIDKIVTDKRTQPRAVIDEYVVNEYRLDMAGGDDFPPLMVFGENGSYYLADGWHRLLAAKQLSRDKIECAVKPGGLREAILYSVAANADHGKRRTNGDKTRAVKKLLLDPEWSQWSDREIARRCRVDHGMVGKLRPSLVENASERKYTTKHGTTAVMKTENIGKPQEPEHEPPTENHYTLSMPEVMPAEPKYNPLNYQLITCPVDELSAHIEPDSVDAIITDPPYPKEYIYTYEQLAEAASIVLKPSGVLVAMAGHPYIDTLIELMKQHLNYHWLGCYYMPSGHHASLPYYSVSVYWKPLLIFSKGDWPKTLTFRDVYINDDADKQYHEWGQGVSGFKALVNGFTKPNQTVLDPFVGGGTTAIAALEAGRYFIGSDISNDEVEKTRARLRRG